jgi:hypothetical protein
LWREQLFFTSLLRKRKKLLKVKKNWKRKNSMWDRIKNFFQKKAQVASELPNFKCDSIFCPFASSSKEKIVKHEKEKHG